MNGNDVKSLRRVFMAPFPFDSEVEDAAENFPGIILLFIRLEGPANHLPAVVRRQLRKERHSKIRTAFADASRYVTYLGKCAFSAFLDVLFYFQQF
ncbi:MULTISPECIES: hypothetical protein [unclassified Akkermansia]|uniref:hypothetical protein n=1 Tax=unclassified Akkermansia TaxID=2608915 RepID=UPI00138666F6|nr:MULTISPECIES: hypothetical protein [unclassified Akkermansia]MBS6780119.1 hypothetical protein [Akkermansia sp.]